MTPWVRVAVIIFPVVSILVCLLTWADASSWAHYLHNTRVLFDNLGQEPPPKTPTVPLASYAGVLIILPEVVFAMWQYQAAKVARALSYPSRRDPSWGVIAYMVPVVDLFVPAQALSDCFPADDPGRRLVARTWAMLIVVSLLQSSLIILIPEARPFGLTLLAVTIAANLLLMRWGRDMVGAISDNHRQAVREGQPG